MSSSSINRINQPDQSWENLRFVVVDSESTGLDPKRDRLITIGGVGVERSEIQLSDHFEIMMPIAYNTSSVTIHGITKEQSEAGMEESEALKQFINWLSDAIIVGHHIEHDILMFNHAIRAHYGFELENSFVDTMDLTLRLVEAGVLERLKSLSGYSLDHLAEAFGIVPHDRHTASGDAFITAQVFIRLLRASQKCSWFTLGELCQRFKPSEELE